MKFEHKSVFCRKEQEMNKAGEDNRSVRNTRKKLRDGLLRLMEIKPINEISVKELTDLVDVNRGTFYFHYTDIYDMLHKMEDEFFVHFSEVLHNTIPLKESIYPYLNAIFSVLGENRSFCKIMLGPYGDMQFVEQIKLLVSETCSHIWREAAPGADSGKFEMYNAFIINGCIGIFQKWLDDAEHGGSPEEISQLAATIIHASLRPSIS